MKFDGRELKRNSKKMLRANFWAIAAILTFSNIMAYGITYVQDMLTSDGQLAYAFYPLIAGVIVMSPIVIGMYRAYRRIIDGGERYRVSELFEWYGDLKKLWLSIKSYAYYSVVLMLWALVYFVAPIFLTYLIWGNSLLSNDLTMNVATMMIIITGVIIVAAVPYAVHMVRYSGGLYLAAEDSHLTVRQRFEYGRDIFRGNTYKYVALMLSFLPWLVLTIGPCVYIFFDYIANKTVSATALVLIPCLLLFQYFVIPYMTLTGIQMFDVMRGKDKNK